MLLNESGIFDLISKIVIPTSTFILGASFTFFTKLWERNIDANKEDVSLAAELLTDWYNQLQVLWVALKYHPNDMETKKILDGYTTNRIILPKLLQIKERLSKKKKNIDIVNQVNEFLHIVTNSERVPLNYSFNAQHCLLFNDMIARDGRPSFFSKNVFEDLDRIVQRANILAGRYT